MTEQVYRVSASSSDRPLHTDPDCVRLDDAIDPRGPFDRSRYPDAPLCQWCAGDAATKGNAKSSREYVMALKEASADD